MDIPHGLTVQGRTTELPGLGMPGTNGDEDSDAGPFSAPEFPGHHGHFVGGKPPPSTLPPMRHAGPLL